MIPIKAFGATSPTARTISRTIDALVLNKSSLVMPGFLGTPAGTITTSAFLNASYFKIGSQIIKVNFSINRRTRT